MLQAYVLGGVGVQVYAAHHWINGDVNGSVQHAVTDVEVQIFNAERHP